jgi:hypothetical protein
VTSIHDKSNGQPLEYELDLYHAVQLQKQLTSAMCDMIRPPQGQPLKHFQK